MIVYGGKFLILIRPPYLCDNGVTWCVSYRNLYDITGCVICCWNIVIDNCMICGLITWYVSCCYRQNAHDYMVCDLLKYIKRYMLCDLLC